MISWDHIFKPRKTTRQGDPLYLVLFNIVVDMLAIILARAKDDGQVKGLVPHLIEDGLLFYNMWVIQLFYGSCY
jgi:hypothetical protein